MTLHLGHGELHLDIGGLQTLLKYIHAGWVQRIAYTVFAHAFNLPGEDAAFDRLERNLSEELVPGVYLDSRRRLTAGTRKGAEVTVKDVSVISVDVPIAFNLGDRSFTYPCKWVVTARVKHWQHIHDRQNKYVGELTIRVENDRWKISHLELLSEEREVVWQNS